MIRQSKCLLAKTLLSGRTAAASAVFPTGRTWDSKSDFGKETLCQRSRTFNPPIRYISTQPSFKKTILPGPRRRPQSQSCATCSRSHIFISRYSSTKSYRHQDLNREGDEELTEEEQKVLAELEAEEARYYDERLKRANTNSRKDDQDSASLKLQESISEAYVPFENQQRIIQDVIDEIWNPAPQPQKEDVLYQPPPEFLQRGKTGVLELAELVDLLRKENCIEVVTIGIPKEIDYADHMVIVTCRSPRHLLAVATYVRKRFKMKELKKTDVIPTIVTRNGTQGWIGLDLGNIVLHLFLQQKRDHYDLEMLWTVGPIYDDLCNTEDPEIIQLLNLIK